MKMRCWLMVAALASSAAGWLIGCSDKPEEKRLTIYCAAGIKKPAELLAAGFTAAPVVFEFAGTDRLLSRLSGSRPADRPEIFIAAEESYAEQAAELGLVDRREVLGYLVPVIVVSKQYSGPKITSVADLARPGLRVSLGETRGGPAIGRVSEKLLADAGVLEAVARNAHRAGTVHDVALPVALGRSDAAIVWHDTARQGDLPDKVDVVPIPNPPRVRIIICRVVTGPNKDLADQFIDLAISDAGRAAFRQAGYLVAPPATQPDGH